MCKKQLTTTQNTPKFRKSSASPLSTHQTKEGKFSKTPEDPLKKVPTVKSDRLSSMQPVTSAQFKALLNQRRALLLSNK